MTTDFTAAKLTNAVVRTIVGMTGAMLLATTFVGAATAPAKADSVSASLSTRTI